MPELPNNQVFLTYGLDEGGSLVHISKVKNGLGCNCLCPNCKSLLVAKNNPLNKKKAHFAHHSGKECDGAYESALHLLAKAVIQETKSIFIPNYHFDYNPNNEQSIYNLGKSIVFNEIILEETFQYGDEKIIVDAVGYIEGKKVLIEFANTHFVDNRKWEKIVRMGFPCIEIDLSNQQLDIDSLIEFFNSDTDMKYWILNPRFDEIYKNEIRKREEQQRKESEIRNLRSKQKFETYKANRQYRIISLYKDSVSTKCPKYLDALKPLKKSKYYFNRHLRRLIDGAYWNEEIYGYPPNGCHIYIDGSFVSVLPADMAKEKYSTIELDEMNLFYSGLKKIQSLISDRYLTDCKNCEYSVDRFIYDNKERQVCKYPIK